jgi:hypothetical protein
LHHYQIVLYRIAKQVSAETRSTIHIRSVFERHETELIQLYTQANGCVGLKETNFFNALYTNLDASSADLLRQRLTEAGIEVSESTVNPVRDAFITQTPVSTYQTLMQIPRVWELGGGKGEKADCTLLEFSFRQDRSNRPNQPELTRPASAILPDDRRTQANWDRIRHQVSNAVYGDENHADATLSILTASHTHTSRWDSYKGIVPHVNLQTLVSFRQIDPTDTTSMPSYQPEIALLKASLYARRNSILLLELQINNGQPAETNRVLFWLIYMAVNCLGITVIEPAGNDTQNIGPRLTLDSGAILAGAATQSGRRYICQHNHAIGHQSRFVFAPIPVSVFNETVPYAGTSAASAIIAGVACQIQSVYFEKCEKYLKPLDLRERLCDPNTKAADVYRGREKIGIIPNVKLIVDKLIVDRI